MKLLTIALIAIATLIFPVIVFAYEPEPQENTGIAITVVVPRNIGEMDNPAPQTNFYHLYPVHVWESRDNNRREIIRVYELGANENPAHIRREPFERDGFRFELAEIVRREIPAHSIREHVEIVEVSTQSNDLATVIRLLAPTLDYLTDDGYFGVLALDIASIEIESQGTTNSNFTATQTREFPHLSSPDTSLVPRTISANGRTYNLVDVSWQNQQSTAVDYTQVATTFTAVATYSRTGIRTATIGYTTRAEYRGQISRIAVGRTEFTAHFIGIPIVTPAVEIVQPYEETDKEAPEAETPTQPPAPTTIESVTVESVNIGGIVIEAEQIIPPTAPIEVVAEYEYEATAEYENESGSLPIRNIALVLGFIVSVVFAYFVGKKGIAMFKAMKKTACVLLLLGMLFSFGYSYTVYAVELPRYAFGRQSEDSTTHYNPQTHEQSANDTIIHFNPSVSSNPDWRVMHFNPSVSDVGARASPYNYGEVIGVLTVERLGRTVNVIAGATMDAMDFGAGHFSFSGLNSGNTALIGHNRGRTNGFFSFVRNLQEGDILTLEAGGIVRSYAVAMMYIIDYTDFEPLMQFSDNRLTLVTCLEYQRTKRRIAVAFEI